MVSSIWTLVCRLILSSIDYCNAVLHGTLNSIIQKLQRVKNNAAHELCSRHRGVPVPSHCCIGCQFSSRSSWHFLRRNQSINQYFLFHVRNMSSLSTCMTESLMLQISSLLLMEIWRLNTPTTRILSSHQLMCRTGQCWSVGRKKKVTIWDLTEPSLLKLYLQAASTSPLEVCRYRYQESVVWLPSRCSTSQCRIICLSWGHWQVCAVSICSEVAASPWHEWRFVEAHLQGRRLI